MSSIAKAKLKVSREAIQAKDWSAASQAADEVLEYDAHNYNAHVFKALALLHQGQREQSQLLYERAIDIQPTQPLAWQGLEKLLTEAQQWQSLAEILQRQVQQASTADDAIRCAETVQRLVALQRQHAARSDLIAALSLYLPTSPYYALLSSLPLPDQFNPTSTSTFDAQMAVHVESLKVLLEIVHLIESSETETMDREVDKRKTRLDSMSKSRELLRNEIGVEIWSTSVLPDLYEQVLAHVHASDEQRRDAEHKLLVYRYNILKALPSPTVALKGSSGTAAITTSSFSTAQPDNEASQRKSAALQTVEKLATGIVSIDVPDELAWSIVIEWHDTLHLADQNRQRLRAFVDHFPRTGLALAIEALLLTINDEQFGKEQEERRKELPDETKGTRPDPLTLALDGLEQAPQSVLAHRIAASLYLIDRDWTSTSEVAAAGLQLARRLESQLGVKLEHSKTGLEAVLAASLTYLHPPQHHARALRLCDAVLGQDAQNIEALMSRASMAQTAGRWQEARAAYVTVQQVDDSEAADKERYAAHRSLSVFNKPGREARSEVAWCDVHLDRLAEAEEELRQVIEELGSDDSANVTDEARTWWRLGQCLWRMGDEHQSDRSQAFACFIAALKKDATFAPAFTSLGWFYAEVSQPPDMQRASKCFQKAFELDGRENEAAEQLAKMYADEEDWDLVDLVARRTIEAEGGAYILQQQADSIASQRRHTTKNAWAWSAIGSTELFRGNFERAITALQVALRSFPRRQDIWMRLGDAYVASGRLSAAIKTYEHAENLQTEEEKWQARFSIADVQRQLGMFDESIEALEAVARRKPDLVQVRISCAETRLLLTERQVREGYTARARRAIRSAIKDAKTVIEERRNNSQQAAWKVLSDGLLRLSRMERHRSDQHFVEQVVLPLVSLGDDIYKVDERLPSISSISSDDVVGELGATPVNVTLALRLAASYIAKLRILLLVPEQEVAGSVWMDLSITLQLTVDARREHKDEAGIKTMHSQAIACAKEALKFEPGNGTYWCGLGNLVFSYGVSLAQHCYIKAIECDAKDVVPWSNLGYLYLAHDDIELAAESFVRAQTLNPEYSQAWVGQALVAQRRGQRGACRSLFRHAFTIDQDAVLEAAYGFAFTTFSAAWSAKTAATPLAVVRAASSALTSYLAHRPNDVAVLHLSALFCERLDELDAATERIEVAASILEKQYERQESTDTAQQFAVCMANLGRIHLAAGRFSQAIEVLTMCLGLLDSSGDEQSAIVSADDVNRARLGAHCGIGLAYYASGKREEAVQALQQALEDVEASSSSDELIAAKEALTALLAQIEWHTGKHDEAEAVLMDHLASAPSSLDVITRLGAVSWLMGNNEQLDAVQSDLRDVLLVRDDGGGGPSSAALSSASVFLAIVALYDGGEQVERAIEMLRTQAITSLKANIQLVEARLRIAIGVVAASDGEQRAAAATAAAVGEAQALYAKVKRSKDASSTLILARAQTLLSVALTLSGSEKIPAEQSGTFAKPSRSARALAIHAVRLTPNSVDAWRFVEDVASL